MMRFERSNGGVFLPQRPAIIRPDPWERDPRYFSGPPGGRVGHSSKAGGGARMATSRTPVVIYNGSGGSATNAETYTFNNVPFGTAMTGRVVVWCMNFNGIPGAFSLDSLTIGGVAGTAVTDGGPQAFTFMFYSVVPTGDTGTLFINFASGPGNAVQTNWTCYSIYHLNSPTPTDSLTSDAEPPTGTIDVQAGGVLIACSRTTSATNTGSWTGVTEDTEFTTEAGGSSFSSGMTQLTAAETGRTVTRDWTTDTSCGLVAGAWR